HNAGVLSIMCNHTQATDLDAWHKLKSGFAMADAIETTSFSGPQTLTLPAVERDNHEVTVLFDRNRADREYFVIENRLSSDGTPTYDQPIVSSVVLWHVIEDFGLRHTYPF